VRDITTTVNDSQEHNVLAHDLKKQEVPELADDGPSDLARNRAICARIPNDAVNT